MTKATQAPGEVQEFYDSFLMERMDNYRREGNLRIDLATKLLLSVVRPKDVVADIGCGIGLVTESIAKAHPEVRAIGVDLSPANIQYAQKTVKISNTVFSQADITEQFERLREFSPQGYDVITLVDVIEHIPEDQRPKMLEELASISKPNTLLVLTYPSPDYQRYLMRENPAELQVIDNIIEVNALCAEAAPYGWGLRMFRKVDVWLRDQYIHCILDRNPNPRALRPVPTPLLKRVKEKVDRTVVRRYRDRAARKSHGEARMRRHAVLAIAAPAFNLPSETFIRNHALAIAPDETVLLSQYEGSDALPFPTLQALSRGPRSSFLPQRAVNSLRRRWQERDSDGRLSEAARQQAVAFLQAYRPKAVLAEYGGTGWLFMDICADAGLPMYVHFHGYDASMLLEDTSWIERYQELFRRASGIIAPSQFLGDKLLAIGCPPSKLHISPYGIDPQRFTPMPHASNRLLAVGRLVDKKAPQYTIAAFAKIARRFPEARLDIVGDGPLSEQCRAQIANLGLDGRVVLHGAQSSEFVADLMQRASIFVQHSVTAPNGDTEGLPVAILEAMASGLPLVSTRHSGIPEAVLDGVTGILVEEHDVDGMAEAMGALLENPERAEAMGAAGRERMLAHFTQDGTRDRLREIMGLSPAGVEEAEAVRAS